MTTGPGALERLIAPFGVEEFITQYWMQRSFFVRGGPDKVGDLFSLDSFHAAVAAAARRTDAPQRGFSVRAGATRTIMPWTIASEVAAGETICVSAIEVGDARLAELAAELKRELAFAGRVGVHAYLSPRGSGFSFLHFDARIATTLQIAGRKRWRYAERSSLPWPAHNVRFAPDGRLDWHQPPAAWEERVPLRGDLPLAEVVLEPGDLLCLPAGTFHAAEAVDDVSLSININFNYGGFFDLVGAYLNARLPELAGWREAPPAPLPGELERGGLPPRVVEFMVARLDELRRVIDELDPRNGGEVAALWHRARRPE